MRKRRLTIGLTIAALSIALPAIAAAPTGADTFQLLTGTVTGSDNTGDGGTGLNADLNYYYVGQSFTTTMEIKSGGTDAANIWIDHDTTNVTPSALTDGTYYPIYAGQNTAGGQVRLTGFRTSGTSSGTGTFGTVTWTVIAPNALSLVETAPETLDIDVGSIGGTTESNISLVGADILDDEEDFDFHAWADITKPFAENPSPTDTATGIAVESNYTFDLRDTKNGEGDNTGVGTGVDTSEPPGSITFDDGGGPVSETDDSSFSCSGTWGTNLCNTTVNPDPPSGISGDTRNFDYSTTYTVTISGYQDLASGSQDQLAEANGPNTMDAKVYTFTTEADTVAPEVVAESPVRSSSGNPVGTIITIDVHDKKAYPGTISGTGVVSNTCDFNISSPTFALTTFDEGDAEVTVTAIDYGYRYTIDPSTDFGINETVTVSAFNCEDVAGNTMTTDTWTFTTSDNIAPFVDQQSPADDDVVDNDTDIVFHIKDTGSGVDLSEVVIYINGEYWTDGGGAGTVTSSGTSITFAASNDFNGGNYAGDGTSVTGTADDYTFTIDPENDFTEGEAVPILIYADDIDGNSMERVVYALAVEDPNAGGAGGGGGGNGGGGGGGRVFPVINDQSITVVQIDEDSVLVSWTTNLPGSSQILYGTSPVDSFGSAPLYNYQFSTPEQNPNSRYHSQIINNLTPETVYYFRPISVMSGQLVFGDERPMAPKFGTTEVVVEVPAQCPVIEHSCPIEEPVIIERPSTPTIIEVPVEIPVPVPPPTPIPEPIDIFSGLEITDIERTSSTYSVFGSANPNETIKIRIF